MACPLGLIRLQQWTQEMMRMNLTKLMLPILLGPEEGGNYLVQIVLFLMMRRRGKVVMRMMQNLI